MATASDTNSNNDIELPVVWSSTEDAIKDVENDTDLTEMASHFDTNLNLDPDKEFKTDSDSLNSDSIPRDSDSTSNTSSIHRETDDKTSSKDKNSENGDSDLKSNSPELAKSSSSNSSPEHKTISGGKISKSHRRSVDSTSSKNSDPQKSNGSTKNPLKLLRRLTKFDKSSRKQTHTAMTPSSALSAVVIDKLPQVFVAKYLGHRPVTGVAGLQHVRKPVDEMVKDIKAKVDTDTEVQLPLVYVVISPKGLDIRDHKSNKNKDGAPLGLMPIDFISYGVQDIKYWRVFTCIVVRELSSRSKTATCHAFLCDSSHNGRKMALALGASFSVYSKNLKKDGKDHNFQVELRPPDELSEAVVEFDA